MIESMSLFYWDRKLLIASQLKAQGNMRTDGMLLCHEIMLKHPDINDRIRALMMLLNAPDQDIAEETRKFAETHKNELLPIILEQLNKRLLPPLIKE